MAHKIEQLEIVENDIFRDSVKDFGFRGIQENDHIEVVALVDTNERYGNNTSTEVTIRGEAVNVLAYILDKYGYGADSFVPTEGGDDSEVDEFDSHEEKVKAMYNKIVGDSGDGCAVVAFTQVQILK